MSLFFHRPLPKHAGRRFSDAARNHIPVPGTKAIVINIGYSGYGCYTINVLEPRVYRRGGTEAQHVEGAVL